MNIIRFIGDNKAWVFDGIAGVIVTLAAGYFIYRWQKRERLMVTPKRFSVAYDRVFGFLGFNPNTMEHETHEASLGVEPASLQIICHNVTSIPVTLDQIILLNADSGEEIVRHDVNPKRIDANDNCEIAIPLGSTNAHYYKPPTWQGRIVVRTIRKRPFSSTPFTFGNLT